MQTFFASVVSNLVIVVIFFFAALALTLGMLGFH